MVKNNTNFETDVVIECYVFLTKKCEHCNRNSKFQKMWKVSIPNEQPLFYCLKCMPTKSDIIARIEADNYKWSF